MLTSGEVAPPEGIYAKFYKMAGFKGRPALFIDRDGVVVEEVNYLCRTEDVSMIEGACEAIAAFNGLDIPVIMVTNQAGIGRGYFGWKEFEEVQAFIIEALGRKGARLDAVIACPFHEDGVGEFRAGGHPFRKPNPGMMLWAAERMGLSLAGSWMVGDKLCDVEAAIKAGLKGAVHVETGHGKKERAAVAGLKGGACKVVCASNLASVEKFLIKELGGQA